MNTGDERHAAKSFINTVELQKLSYASFGRHSKSPHVPTDTYFSHKIRKLGTFLENKTLLYLDTNHWVNLRHVVLESRLEAVGYREVLALLENLLQQGRICCPVSFLLFIELTKQSDANTRTHTAKLMDHFSQGICFQFPPEMARSELRHFLLKTAAKQNLGPKPWVWTKAGFLVGEILPTVESIDEPINTLIQKGWIDVMWEVGLTHLQSEFEFFKSNIEFWYKYAEASNADALFYRSSTLTYEEILYREKALLIRKLMKDELHSVAAEIWKAFPQCRDSLAIQNPTLPDYSPWNFPSLQVLAGISAAAMRSTMKFEANDMLDFRHAALAIPYCNAIFCDSGMATILRNKPCEFGSVYGAEVLGTVDEVLSFLKRLNI